MKTFLRLFIIAITGLLISCSDDDSGNSFLKGRTFRLSAVLLSQPVDLNQDGIASLDMTEEIACMTGETISFAASGNKASRMGGFYGIILSSTLPPTTNEADYYECGNLDQFSNITYKMTSGNTVQLTIIPTMGSEHKVSYTFEGDNKLVKTEIEQYPVAYDEATHKWHNAALEVRREFTAYSN